MWTALLICLIIIIIYPYSIYPPILKKLAGRRHFKPALREEAANRTVSVIIGAYNEEKVIYKKVLNTLNLKYPEDKLEVLVGSDGSTDKTYEALEQFENNQRVKRFKFNRIGKSSVIKKLVAQAAGEILVFSDATSVVTIDALEKLVKYFDDDNVGAVAGNIRFTEVNNGKEKAARSHEGLFERYEKYVKRYESKLGVVIGASGALYAVRREFADTLGEMVISDDFSISMAPFLKNKKVILEEDAEVVENESLNMKQQAKRYFRLGAGGLQALIRFRKLLLPGSGLPAFAFWSHRVIRWITPILLLLCIPISLAMSASLNAFVLLSALQILSVILSILYYYNDTFARLTGKAGIIFKYLVINYALFAGSIQYLLGKQYSKWTPVR